MLRFGMNMPFSYMALYGSIMVAAVLLLRLLLKKRLPGFVFPMLWAVVILRFLVPFSLSSPLSMPVPEGLIPAELAGVFSGEAESAAVEDAVQQIQAGSYSGGTPERDRNGNAPEGGKSGSLPEDGMSKNVPENGKSGSTLKDGMSGNVQENSGSESIPEEGMNGYVSEGSISENVTDVRIQSIPDGRAAADVQETVAVSYGSGRETGLFFIGSLTGRKLLAGLYLLGFMAVAGSLAWQKYRCTLRLKNSLLMEQNETVNGMLRELNMGHVLVFTNDEIPSPLVSGLLNPRIYLPARIDFRNTVLLRHILNHETMHIRHRDNWLKTFMLITLCLNWYNPLVWVMSRCLSADLETACDEGVLAECDEEGKKSYAYSLLAMAVNGGRPPMLYSAFSRTEVERRVKNVVRYRKATALAVLFSVLFLAGSTVVFATGGQAPFSSYLTSYCAGAYSRWGVKVEVTRGLTLGENAQNRAEEAVFAALRADTSEDPEILEEAIKTVLADTFGVERRAFHVKLSLCLSREEVEAEYSPWGLTLGEDSFWLWQGEQIRTFEDKMRGAYQCQEKGAVDISVERDRYGNLTAVNVLKEGDAQYDERTREIEENRRRGYGMWEGTTESLFGKQGE